LPIREQLALLVGLTSQLGGTEQERLEDLAQNLGLLEAATSACSSAIWWERLHGVRTLLLLGTYDRIPMALVKDEHALVRAEAVRRWTDRPIEGVPHLLRLIDDPSPVGRFAVQDALLRMGGAVAEPLAEYLEDPRSAGLEAGLEVAARLAHPSHHAVAQKLSTTSSSSVRARAASLLGALGGEQGGRRLLEMLSDSEPEVRQAALRALGRLGEWSVAPQVAALLSDEDWHVRRAAALASLSLGSAGQLFLSKISRETSEAGVMARYALSLPESAREAAL
jgi:HEAT repeat protein